MGIESVLAGLGVLVPFPFYYWVWTYPGAWRDVCRRVLGGGDPDPCKAMARVSHCMKLIQFLSLYYSVLVSSSSSSVVIIIWPPPLYFWPLIIVGQFLNIRVYQLLGESGTYYGVRFGKKIPWVTKFPFGYIRDPQYVGSIMSLVACSSWVPFQYILLWVLGYVFIMRVESFENPATRAT